MASPAEAMKWHTERFLGNGSGSGIDAYPKVDENGSVSWYKFSDGKPTTSPLGQPSELKKTQNIVHEESYHQSKLTAEELQEIVTARNLCRIACTRSIKDNCRGAHGFGSQYVDAFCSLEDDQLFPVTGSQLTQAASEPLCVPAPDPTRRFFK